MSNMPTSGQPLGNAQNPQLLNEIQTEVSSEAAPLLQFLTEHAIKIMLLLGLFVVAVAGLGAYNWYKSSTLEAAQSELHTINLNKEGKERITALDAFLTTAPAELQSTILLSLAEASMQTEDFERAAKAYGQLAGLNIDSATEILGTLNQGQALILAGKGQEALQALEGIVSKVPTQQSITIQQAIAEAAILSGNTAKAKAAFEAIANSISPAEAELYNYRIRALDAATTEKK